MKHFSLQWRITLMTVLLIGATCVIMNLLLCSSGVYYMDTIADSLQGGDVYKRQVVLNGVLCQVKDQPVDQRIAAGHNAVAIRLQRDAALFQMCIRDRGRTVAEKDNGRRAKNSDVRTKTTVT